MCPYCKKENYIPDYVLKNVEAYGPGILRFPCIHCNKTVKATFYTKISISNITTTTEESDW